MTLRPPDRPVGKRRQSAVFMAEGLGASYARHQQTVDQPAGASSSKKLSARHLQVLRLMAEGFTNEKIAERLVIGVKTVNAHVYTLTNRLGARNRAHAVAIAIRGRIID